MDNKNDSNAVIISPIDRTALEPRKDKRPLIVILVLFLVIFITAMVGATGERVSEPLTNEISVMLPS